MNVARWYRSSGKKSTSLLKLSRKIRPGCRRLETSWDEENAAWWQCHSVKRTCRLVQPVRPGLTCWSMTRWRPCWRTRSNKPKHSAKRPKMSIIQYPFFSIEEGFFKCLQGIAWILCNGVCCHYAQPTLQQALQLKAEIDAAGCSKLWKRTLLTQSWRGFRPLSAGKIKALEAPNWKSPKLSPVATLVATTSTVVVTIGGHQLTSMHRSGY